ncbi:NUDIX domain-containing protein [Bacillus massiliglaciei]|uniref:NUDIX domain-containing protein n=1 Tax=Bacillus massiliglaciei TaxID=1816693 RepID=UPI000A8B4A34|nr:NUDIX domain-containing protein [Bacillus massiliglaciei]
MGNVKKVYRTPDGYTADIAVFTITSTKTNEKAPPSMHLKIMLIKRAMKNREGEPNIEAGKWALPGGFVMPNETAGAAAARELKEETGVSGFLLKHFGVYDQPGRDPRGWIITNAFFAIVQEEFLYERKADDDAAEVELFTLEELSGLELAFDHDSIIHEAIAVLKQEMSRSTIAKQFLPKEFTLSELQRVLLAVGPDPKISADSLFFSKAPRLPFLERITDENGMPKKTKRNSFRPSQLYRFNQEAVKDSIYY